MAGARQGGAELFFERLCLAQHQDGETVLPVIRADAARATRLRAGGLDPVPLRFGGAWDVLTPRRLHRRLRGFGPEVAVAWMGRAAAATQAGPWTLIGRLGGYYDLRRFRNCRYLVANTPALAAWIRAEGAPPERVRVLPNFAPDHAGAAAASRAALGVPEGVPLVLALGRLHPVKGFDTLIRALASLPDAYCVIAGEGAARQELSQLARSLGVAPRLRLPGWRQDTGALLAACDVFVCPSRQEPLGNTILEAWSAARPIVATIAEGPGALLRGGQTGELVPIDDPAALAAAISDLLRDPGRAAALARAGRARYEAEFAPGPVLAAWRHFLHGLV